MGNFALSEVPNLFILSLPFDFFIWKYINPPKFFAILGSATLTMVTSIIIMKKPKHSAINEHRFILFYICG